MCSTVRHRPHTLWRGERLHHCQRDFPAAVATVQPEIPTNLGSIQRVLTSAQDRAQLVFGCARGASPRSGAFQVDSGQHSITL